MRTGATRDRLYAAAILVGLALAGGVDRLTTAAVADDLVTFRPKLVVPETLEPFLKHMEPGGDAFPSEREAAELEARLRAWGQSLQADPAQGVAALAHLLAAGFRGGRLADPQQRASGGASFEVIRSSALPREPILDTTAFVLEVQRLVGEMRRVHVAEFIVTSIEMSDDSSTARTDVRYDLVGTGAASWRVQHAGEWRLLWRRADAGWQIAAWTATSHVASRAKAPVFSDVTEAALERSGPAWRQFSTSLDAWMASLDSVLTRDSNGHHGVSVGDADGDGLDDLYVAQPSGLPNRLLRAVGDGTFEDVTDRSGLGVLDDTAQSLFADVDNDGDQDLVLATSTRPLLFVNDGTGRFTIVIDAFRFQRPLEGVLTSIAMADYDRDGLLDLYLCVYSYFFGAGEDKAGTPAPYYDARNGPPGVLLRNAGGGRFQDVTDEAGLGPGNDRYHFAAAWADYDGNGWPDLLVANDFGTKNLYRNLGRRDGTVTFQDVAAEAGVLDHGAGMSAAFFDYDNDGLLDIYTGNMWSASGLRVTASPRFMPDAPADVRALYRRHARGNSLFRNRGDGRFEEKTLEARAEMGRWAWSSDALDFDSDGWDDLLVVNGMLTRKEGPGDLESFFWRQVVSRSPLTRARGTPYDDGWRAINQLLVHGSIASRQRNVVLRNDGRGGFDDVSGAVGLDFEQDGRSFAVLDVDGDGDPDVAVMAARNAPQLRLMRNDFSPRGASIALRLVGTTSNRDAVGARVLVETDRLRRTRMVHAGSGFLSQHSKELLFGLGESERILKLTVQWPSGQEQVFTDVVMNVRLRLTEGGRLESLPFTRSPALPAREALPIETGPAAAGTWLYEPFPAPEFSAQDGAGHTWSLAAFQGRPLVLLFWSPGGNASRASLQALGRGRDALSGAGVGVLAIEVDGTGGGSGAHRPAPPGLPRVVATPQLAVSYAIFNRHMFMNRQDLVLPTAFLIDPSGRAVKAYRGTLDVPLVIRDARAIEVPAAERLWRAIPFQGTFHSPLSSRNFLPYARELMDQGLEAAAIAAFERAAQASPTASTLYRLGTLLAKSGDAARARSAFERALSLQPDLAEASNDLGALLARSGDVEAAIARFRAAIAAAPEYPDALNNLGYALLLTGNDGEARVSYERALELQPDFPEALNNLGMLFGRAAEFDRAEAHFRKALALRNDYGEAANNLALVLVARGEHDEAIAVLDQLLQRAPAFESAYVTLAKIHLQTGRTREGIAALERLLQRNPGHPVALELLRAWKGR